MVKKHSISLEQIEHLPLNPDGVEGLIDGFFKPVEVAQLGIVAVRGDGSTFEMDRLELHYVAGRIERDGEHFLLLASGVLTDNPEKGPYMFASSSPKYVSLDEYSSYQRIGDFPQ